MNATLQAIQRRYGVSLDGPFPIRLKAGRSDLPALCHDLKMIRGAEIGVWKGAFSEVFCRAVPGIKWLAIDPWAPYADYREKKNDATLISQAYDEAKRRLSPYGASLIKASSVDAAADIPDGSLDVVYVDGNHEAPFVRQDLEIWTPKLRKHAILAGHDYRVPPTSKPFIQVKAAVDQYVSDHAIAPWFIFVGDSTPSWMWVV